MIKWLISNKKENRMAGGLCSFKSWETGWYVSTEKWKHHCITIWIQIELTQAELLYTYTVQWERTGDWSRMRMRAEICCWGWIQGWEVKGGRAGGGGGGARRRSRCEAASLTACLHFSANGSVFLTSACFCSLCRCWRVREEHHCEADEVSDCSLFCFSSFHVWQIHM